MTETVKKRRKIFGAVGVVVGIFLILIYLQAVFFAGFWHGDTFLYKQDDGSFAGSDIYAEYKLVIKPADYGRDIEFSVNGKDKYYQIKYDKNDLNGKVEITENEKAVFEGKAFKAGEYYMLLDDNYEAADGIIVHTGDYVPSEEELFPGYTRLYNWAVADKTDMRGEPYMIILILLFGAILLVDIKFPDLFWILEHRMEVDGGEPSDFYRFGQKAGRVIMTVVIIVCIVMTFTVK